MTLQNTLLNTWREPIRICVLVILVALFSGCKHMQVSDRWFDSDRVTEVPSEVMPIWTDTVMHQPGKAGVRGFGGRVYFYEDGKPDPVMVDGQLVVYAFDGNPAVSQNVAPLKKFVFTPDQLQVHHSKTDLGNSYSVWIPWDRVGGEKRTLSLVARFDGRQGGTAMSKPARVLLPGLEKNLDETVSEIQLASFQEVTEVEPISDRTESMSSSSIDLPPSFQRRLSGFSAPAEASSNTAPIAAPTNQSQRGASLAELPVDSYSPTPVTPPATPQQSNFSAEYPATTAQTYRQPSSNWQPLSPREQAVAQASEASQNQQTSFVDPRSAWAEYSFPEPNEQVAAHYAPQRFPARRTPRAQPGSVALRRQPHPAGWQGGLPPTPRNDSRWRNSRDSQALVSDQSESARPQ